MVVRRKKIMKRRRILIALRAVVISSVAERSLLQYGNQHVCTISSTTFLFCIFLLSRTDFLPLYKKDPSTSLGMTIRGKRYQSQTQSLLSNFKVQG